MIDNNYNNCLRVLILLAYVTMVGTTGGGVLVVMSPTFCLSFKYPPRFALEMSLSNVSPRKTGLDLYETLNSPNAEVKTVIKSKVPSQIYSSSEVHHVEGYFVGARNKSEDHAKKICRDTRN